MASRDGTADALSNDAVEAGVKVTETTLDALGGDVGDAAEPVCAAVETPLFVEVICADASLDTDEKDDLSALDVVEAVADALALDLLIVERAL